MRLNLYQDFNQERHNHFVLVCILLLCIIVVLVGLVWYLEKGSNSIPTIINSNIFEVTKARYFSAIDGSQLFFAEVERAVALTHGGLTIFVPRIDLLSIDRSWLASWSQSVQYWRNTKLLSVDKNIGIFRSDGQQVYTQSTLIEMKHMAVIGKEQIVGYNILGALSGENFFVLNQGYTIILTGQSRLRI